MEIKFEIKSGKHNEINNYSVMLKHQGIDIEESFNNIKDVLKEYDPIFIKLLMCYNITAEKPYDNKLHCDWGGYFELTESEKSDSLQLSTSNSSSEAGSISSLLSTHSDSSSSSVDKFYDQKLLGVLFDVIEEKPGWKSILLSLRIPADLVEDFSKLETMDYKIYSTYKHPKSFIVRDPYRNTEEEVVYFMNGNWPEQLLNFVKNTTAKYKEGFGAKIHNEDMLPKLNKTNLSDLEFSDKTIGELLDAFGYAYLNGDTNRLNNIFEMGRKRFPTVFNRDSDNIVGRYCAGDMQSVKSLALQITNDEEYRGTSDDLLQDFARAYTEKDFERITSVIETGIEKFPEVFNKKADNIAGYFLSKDLDKLKNTLKKES